MTVDSGTNASIHHVMSLMPADTAESTCEAANSSLSEGGSSRFALVPSFLRCLQSLTVTVETVASVE